MVAGVALGEEKPAPARGPGAESTVTAGREDPAETIMRLGGADYETIFAAGGGVLAGVRRTRERDEETLATESLARLRRVSASGAGR